VGPQDALEYLIKWKGVSYMHVEWVTPNLMREYRQWGVARMQRMVGSEEGQVRSLIVTKLCNQRPPSLACHWRSVCGHDLLRVMPRGACVACLV
jgi:hypothetical protein